MEQVTSSPKNDNRIAFSSNLYHKFRVLKRIKFLNDIQCNQKQNVIFETIPASSYRALRIF